MKIAVLFSSPGIGGATLGALENITALLTLGYKFVAFMPYEGPMRKRLEALGVPVEVIAYDWWSTEHKPPSPYLYFRRAAGFVNSGLKIAKRAKALGCEAIITNTVVVPAGALAAKFAGLPHFWYLHEFGFEDHGFYFWAGKGTIRRFIARFSKGVVVNSIAMYKVFVKHIPKSKLHLTYYPVPMADYDIQHLPLGPDGEMKMVLAGRITPAKGQEDAIRAVAHCRQKGMNVTLTLMGYQTEDYTPFLKQLAKELQVENAVHIAEFNPDPQAYIRTHHIALICSRFEAFGRVTIEAQKMGLPVVAANTGGSIELIEEGKTGLFYTPGNDIELAEKIGLYYQNEDLRKQIAIQAQAFARRVCNIKHHAQVFDAMIKGNKPEPYKGV